MSYIWERNKVPANRDHPICCGRLASQGPDARYVTANVKTPRILQRDRTATCKSGAIRSAESWNPALLAEGAGLLIHHNGDVRMELQDGGGHLRE